MQKLLTVLKREYMTRIRTKGFIFGTIAMPFFVLLVTIGPIALTAVRTEKIHTLAVIDLPGGLFERIQAQLDQKNAKGQRLYDLKQLIVQPENLDAVLQSQKAELAEGTFDGIIVIPADVFEKNEVQYYGKNVTDFQRNQEIRSAISHVLQEIKLAQHNLDPELVKSLTRRVTLTTIRIERSGREQVGGVSTFMLAFVLVFFLYMALIFYGTYVMRAVIEEKASRVVEVLISSIRPFHLMAGKILGVGSVGLTQFLIWAITASLIFAASGMFFNVMGLSDEAGRELAVPSVGPDVMFYFVLFFVLGYLLFATLYAAVGAMVNSEQEGQQLQMPIIAFLIAPMIMLNFVIRDPGSTISVAMSHIPFFSPIIMFARIVIEKPALPEILLSILLLVASIYVLILLAAKIFRVGILMYGKRPTVPEIWRWLRY